jgi:hypothetical protein
MAAATDSTVAASSLTMRPWGRCSPSPTVMASITRHPVRQLECLADRHHRLGERARQDVQAAVALVSSCQRLLFVGLLAAARLELDLEAASVRRHEATEVGLAGHAEAVEPPRLRVAERADVEAPDLDARQLADAREHERLQHGLRDVRVVRRDDDHAKRSIGARRITSSLCR